MLLADRECGKNVKPLNKKLLINEPKKLPTNGQFKQKFTYG